MKTKRTLIMAFQGHTITIKEGAHAVPIQDGMGLTHYALASPASAVVGFEKGSMLAHDLKYRHVWIDEKELTQ